MTKHFPVSFRHYSSNPGIRVVLRARHAFGVQEHVSRHFFPAPHPSRLRQRGGVLAVFAGSKAAF